MVPEERLTGHDDAFPTCFWCLEGKDMCKSDVSNVDEIIGNFLGDYVVDNTVVECGNSQIK